MLSRTVHGTPRSSYFFFLVCEYEQILIEWILIDWWKKKITNSRMLYNHTKSLFIPQYTYPVKVRYKIHCWVKLNLKEDNTSDGIKIQSSFGQYIHGTATGCPGTGVSRVRRTNDTSRMFIIIIVPLQLPDSPRHRFALVYKIERSKSRSLVASEAASWLLLTLIKK